MARELSDLFDLATRRNVGLLLVNVETSVPAASVIDEFHVRTGSSKLSRYWTKKPEFLQYYGFMVIYKGDRLIMLGQYKDVKTRELKPWKEIAGLGSLEFECNF